MRIFVETERLILREILPTEADGLFQLDSDPEVQKYLVNNPIKNKERAIAVINFSGNNMQKMGLEVGQ